MGALIFDLDGVVADTASAHLRSWTRMTSEAGLTFDDRLRAAVLGRTRGDSLDLILRGVQRADRDALLARKQSYFLEELTEMSPDDVLPGVRPLIDAAHVAGIPVGLGSSSSNVAAVLDRLQLADHFAVIGDARSVPMPKPAPDIFLWVAARLGVPPRACTVIEDAAAGVRAARAAGCRVVTVGGIGGGDLDLMRLTGVDLATIMGTAGLSGTPASA